MSEAELMAAVWADPDIPVQLVAPDCWEPYPEPIHWPRVRVAIPPGGYRDNGGEWVWRHRCPCRAVGSFG